MLNDKLILDQASCVRELMNSQDVDGALTYHNWYHVEHVMSAAKQLAVEAALDHEQAEDLVLASIWHDADFANGAKGHEQRSSELAKEALAAAGHPEERILVIVRLICATELDYKPKTAMEGMIRDADLSHFGSEEYFNFYDLLLQEMNTFGGEKLNREDWQSMSVAFIEDHHYHSKEAQGLWGKGKLRNANVLKSMNMNKELQETEEVKEENTLSKEERKALKRERKINEPKFNAEKGIETMFRVSLRNHITLSRIADDKANTLISVNAIILSIVLSALFPKMDTNPWLIYPGMALILVSISTIILSTLSTIPKTTHGAVSVEDVKNKKGNLLFFGNFHKMTLEEFEFGIGELMKDGTYLYGSLTRDLFFLGKVLDRKYGLLRRAYVVFVVGLVLSVLLFGWSVLTLAPVLESPETSVL